MKHRGPQRLALSASIPCSMALILAGAARAEATTIAGNAVSFDGVNDFVRVPHHASLGGGTFTIEAWVFISEPDFLRAPIVSKGAWGNYTLAVQGNLFPFPRSVGFTHDIPTGSWSFTTTSNTYAFDAWRHLAVTITPTTRRLYINGQISQDWFGTFDPPLLNTADVNLGRLAFEFGPTVFLTGFLDEVRIWSVERSPAEIADNYNRIIDTTAPGLAGYWNFDEAAGNQNVFDLGPLANHGMLGATLSPDIDDPTRIKSTAPLIPEPAMMTLAMILSWAVFGRRRSRQLIG